MVRAVAVKKSKRVVGLFDWARLKAILQDIQSREAEADTTLLVDDNVRQYVGLQKFVRQKCPHTDWAAKNGMRDTTIEISETLGLSWRGGAHLFLKLCELVHRHQGGGILKQENRNKAPASPLDDIRFSVSQIAKFAKRSDERSDEKKGRAIELLIDAADRWAAKQELNELLKHGFERSKYPARIGDGRTRYFTDFGSAAVVRQWMVNSMLMADLIRQTLDRVAEPSLKSDAKSALVQLAGRDLPKLYERFSRKNFGISHDMQNRVMDTTGVNFVRLAIQAMGLEPIACATIADYWKQMRTTL